MNPTFLTPRLLLVQPWLLDISFFSEGIQFAFVPFIAPTTDRLLKNSQIKKIYIRLEIKPRIYLHN